jgi:dipeptide/tripeptide permease
MAVYFAGTVLLFTSAIDPARAGTFVALFLIALGTGGVSVLLCSLLHLFIRRAQ